MHKNGKIKTTRQYSDLLGKGDIIKTAPLRAFFLPKVYKQAKDADQGWLLGLVQPAVSGDDLPAQWISGNCWASCTLLRVI